MEHVEITEPVSVGDEVFTDAQGEGMPISMYYGRVTKAELVRGGTHWKIQVKPGLDRGELRRVSVVQERLVSRRMASRMEGGDTGR